MQRFFVFCWISSTFSNLNLPELSGVYQNCTWWNNEVLRFYQIWCSESPRQRPNLCITWCQVLQSKRK